MAAPLVFQIPIVNPFRFVNANSYAEIDPRYNDVPFDMKVDGLFNPNGFYAQKWQTNDYTAFQVDSDFTDVAFKIFVFNGGSYYDLDAPYYTPAITTPAVEISGVTWKVYECAINFAGFAEGFYVGVLTYTDENDVVQVIQTSPLDVRVKHEKTLLYEYFNTYNDKGVIWATGIKMAFRIEGLIRNFEAKSLAEEYVDQEYNTYSLNDIPYRTFKNYIGTAVGLPDWVIDKMNVIFTLNSVNVNGTGYAKVSGQSFQITRPEKGYNEDGYAEIDIIPNENFNLEQYNTGTPTNGTVKVIAEVLQYYNNAANIPIAGIFKTHTTLVGIAILNPGFVPFTLKIGTTNGGAEIREIDIPGTASEYVLVGKTFEVATTIYLTGIAGITLDIDVRYDDYDAPNSGGDNVPSSFVPNVEYTYYEYVVGDFIRDWNVATGLGNVGTNFEGCALLDGENGTINDAYLFRMGFDKLAPLLRGTIQGNPNNQLTLTRGELPNEGLLLFGDVINSTPGDKPDDTEPCALQRSAGGQALNYEILKSNIPPNVGLSAKLGAGNPTDITPECLVVARFIKLPPGP